MTKQDRIYAVVGTIVGILVLVGAGALGLRIAISLFN